jgi:hypothetical protein
MAASQHGYFTLRERAPGTNERGGMYRLKSRSGCDNHEQYSCSHPESDLNQLLYRSCIAEFFFFFVHIKSVPLISISIDFSLDSSSVLRYKTC